MLKAASTMNITNKRHLSFLFQQTARGAALLLCFFFLAFQPQGQPQEVPQIKKKVYKNFSVDDNSHQLTEHTVVEYNTAGSMVKYIEYQPRLNGKSGIRELKTYQYDEEGRHVATLVYESEDVLSWKEVFSFDEKGRKKRIDYTHFDFQGKPHHSYSLYEYDQYGNESKITTFDSAGEAQSEKGWKYNAQGEVIVSYGWNYQEQEGKELRRTYKSYNKYDNQGNLVRSTFDIELGDQRWKEVRLFENNYLVEWNKYENGKVVSHFEHRRDENQQVRRYYRPELPPPYPVPEEQPRNVLEEEPFRDPKYRPVWTTTTKTDKDGNIIKIVEREKGRVVNVTYCSYDEQNNLIRRKKIRKNKGWTEELRNEYNRYNQLTKESTFIDGELVAVRSYQYEYYP